MVKHAPSSKKGKKAQIGKSKKSAKAAAKKMKRINLARMAKKTSARAKQGQISRKIRPHWNQKIPIQTQAKKKLPAKAKKIKKQISAKAKHKKIGSKTLKILAKKATGVEMKAKQKSDVAKAAKIMAPTKIAKISTPAKEQRKPRCVVLAGFGLNAEAELAHAFSLAGADAEIVHFSDISSGKKKLENYEIFAIPGGWSFGDDIAGGRVLSNKLKHTFRSQFEAFVSSGKPILGVCNGFQTLVKLGALPNISGASNQEATLTFNKSGRFEDRWVYLKPQKSVCKYFEGVSFINCPVRHGEGQFVPRDKKLLDALAKGGMVPIKYCNELLDDSASYPQNPNGSVENIAGICDPTGKILGLMPHPECSVIRTQFPRFTAGISSEKNSLRFFENIVKAAREYVQEVKK